MKKNNFLFWLLLLSSIQLAFSQEYRENFECCDIQDNDIRDNAFSKTLASNNPNPPLPCVMEWEVVNGTPSIFPTYGAFTYCDGLAGVNAGEGNWYALLATCNSTDAEGVALQYDFKLGYNYSISVMFKSVASTGGSGNVVVDLYLLTTSVANFASNGCSGTPTVPSGSELVGTRNISSGTGWGTYNFVVNGANADYSRLWIRVRNASGDNGANLLLFDDFQLNSPCAAGSTNSNINFGCTTTNFVPKVSNSTTLSCSQIMDNGTNVGINTTSPVVKLHVNGDGLFRGTSRDFKLTNGGTTYSNSVVFADASGVNSYADLMIKGQNSSNPATLGFSSLNSSSATILGTSLSSIPTATAAGSEASDLVFNTQSGGTAISEKVRITGTGNVGIGTNAPATKLHVAGQSLWLTGGDGGAFTTSAGKGLRMYYDVTNDRAMMFVYDYGSGGGAKDILIQHTSGKVGIGVTTAPAAKLHVDVSGFTNTTGIRFVGLLQANDDPRIITSDASGNLHYKTSGGGSTMVTSSCSTTTNLNFPYWNGTANTLSCSSPININTSTNGIGIGMTAGTFNVPACSGCGSLTGPTSAGTSNVALDVNGVVQAIQFFARSDERFKKDIKPITNAAEIINKMKPVSYLWRTGEFKDMRLDGSRQAGFIAQEMIDALPEAVAKDENGYLSINYTMLIPVAIQALKEQQTAIDEIKKQNEELRKALKDVCDYGCDKVNFNSLQNVTKGGEAYLNQNIPNPSSGETLIKYYIPADWQMNAAVLMVTDLTGKTIQTITSHTTGENLVKLSTRELAKGIYNYTLVIDGQVFDTKKMVVE